MKVSSSTSLYTTQGATQPIGSTPPPSAGTQPIGSQPIGKSEKSSKVETFSTANGASQPIGSQPIGSQPIGKSEKSSTLDISA